MSALPCVSVACTSPVGSSAAPRQSTLYRAVHPAEPQHGRQRGDVARRERQRGLEGHRQQGVPHRRVDGEELRQTGRRRRTPRPRASRPSRPRDCRRASCAPSCRRRGRGPSRRSRRPAKGTGLPASASCRVQAVTSTAGVVSSAESRSTCPLTSTVPDTLATGTVPAGSCAISRARSMWDATSTAPQAVRHDDASSGLPLPICSAEELISSVPTSPRDTDPHALRPVTCASTCASAFFQPANVPCVRSRITWPSADVA